MAKKNLLLKMVKKIKKRELTAEEWPSEEDPDTVFRQDSMPIESQTYELNEGHLYGETW